MALEDSCHPYFHRMEVIQAATNFLAQSDKIAEEPLVNYFTESDPAIPVTPEMENCGATVWDLIIRVLEKYNYL